MYNFYLGKLATITDEREEEKKSLEEKLKLLELEHPEISEEDTDSYLIRELEQELRGVSGCKVKPERGCQTEVEASVHHRQVLGIVPEEKDVEQMASKIEDLETSLEQMNVVIQDTESCLMESQQKALHLEMELAKRDTQIEGLVKEGRAKSEAAVKAQQELADLASKATDQAEESEGKVKHLLLEKEAIQEQFSGERHDLLSKINRLQINLNDQDQECKVS